MGIYLNKEGNLTEGQKVQADALGIPHHEFRVQVLQRLAELSDWKMPQTKRTEKMKQNKVYAMNPMLIVGAGSSYAKNLENIARFPGKVLAVDFVFNHLVRKGIIPDYVITLESQQNSVNEHMFEHGNMRKCRNKTKVICSSITRDKVIKHFKEGGIQFERFDFKEEPRCSNVGLLALNYAYEYLKSDKLFLVGFEHVGQKYPPHIYQVWQIDFWYFVCRWQKETIVNCSDGGALYYEDYIVDTTLDDLELMLV